MNSAVKCPNCQKTVEWVKESSFRPFCSKRCRLIDLGEWASENHVISDQTLETTEEFSLSNDDEIENH